jgi:hypothetical protein
MTFFDLKEKGSFDRLLSQLVLKRLAFGLT